VSACPTRLDTQVHPWMQPGLGLQKTTATCSCRSLKQTAERTFCVFPISRRWLSRSLLPGGSVTSVSVLRSTLAWSVTCPSTDVTTLNILPDILDHNAYSATDSRSESVFHPMSSYATSGLTSWGHCSDPFMEPHVLCARGEQPECPLPSWNRHNRMDPCPDFEVHPHGMSH
jgi:hypothetical protein